MSDQTAEAKTTVDEDGIRVEKSFTDDAFPVPAVLYNLSSTRDEPVRVRIVDRIPESFPMERIGFHPEYESENWTAYKDHRIEFERVLEPGESVETVFGIRDEDPDLEGFLETPVIEHVPVGEEIEDVLGTGDTDAVREVLSGDRDALPGMEEPIDAAAETDTPATETDESSPDGDTVTDDDDPVSSETESATDDDPAVADASATPTDTAPAPRTVSAESIPVVTTHDTDASDDDESAAEGTDRQVDTDSTAEDGSTEQSADDVGEHAPALSTESALAAALAAEIRADQVDQADLDTLRSALDSGVPKSVDVRIARLQSSVADIEAYADALAEFIDEEGTARAVLDDLDQTVEAVEDEVATLTERVDTGDDERDAIRDDLAVVDESVDTVDQRVAGVESTVTTIDSTVDELEEDVGRIGDELGETTDLVDDLDADVETLYEQVDDAAAGVEATEARLDELEASFSRFDEEFDDLWDDLAEVDTRLTDIEGRLGEDLADVSAEIDAINDHLEELEAFRKRLNEAFGP